jgi:ABC-type Mn2+/Zn2+ transport system ATPase subunit
VTLAIEPGDSVGIVGPSGRGKTTLVKVILNVFKPAAGETRYGGVPKINQACVERWPGSSIDLNIGMATTLVIAMQFRTRYMKLP